MLACTEESGTASLTAVAARARVLREVVRKWRVRFAEEQLDGLADARKRLLAMNF